MKLFQFYGDMTQLQAALMQAASISAVLCFLLIDRRQIT